MNLNTPLFQVAGIGPISAQKLTRLNLFKVEDLLHHYPSRYDDFSNVTSTVDAQVGEKVTITGEIWSIRNIYTRTGKVLTEAILNDGNSPITLTWFNQSWLTKQISVGDNLQVSGKVSKYKNKISIVAPVWEKTSVIPSKEGIQNGDQNSGSRVKARDDNTSLHTGRLVPVYPETFGVTSKWLRTKISALLPRMKPFIIDPLPTQILSDMKGLDEALNLIHFPNSWDDVKKAQTRLGFDELFFIQLATLKVKNDWKQKVSVDTFEISAPKLQKFIKSIPFQLTKAQLRVINEVLEDLSKGIPMNRLVQGEVGSGKTIVAAVIAYITYLNGFKTLYMAPTEILAFQHQATLSKLLSPFGIEVGIYTGSKKSIKGIGSRVQGIEKNKKTKPQTLTPDPYIIVGTHALLSEKLALEDVGLVIVDEQQRFGVEQRSLLRSKAKIPHFLTMTATPIPRTVALTLYGDLDLSIIDELPKGRRPVKTFVVPNKKRADAYEFIRKHVKAGEQVYIITPLIDFSETLQTVKAAKVEFAKLQKDVFPDLKLGLLHGKLKSKEKEEVLNSFKDHQIDILVSTSVVEVGVDVSNATIMVIEGAERFGLSQLHQLRGRVGRGELESFCLLFSENPHSSSRLKNLETTYDGLKLAELDLKIRGSGEVFGTRQAGRFELKIASLSDLTLIEKTRTAAAKLLQDNPTLDKYPLLRAKLTNLDSISPD